MASEQPKPTIWSGWPPTEPPTIPFEGTFESFGFAPAYCENPSAHRRCRRCTGYRTGLPVGGMPILIGVDAEARIAEQCEVASTAIATVSPRRNVRCANDQSSSLPFFGLPIVEQSDTSNSNTQVGCSLPLPTPEPVTRYAPPSAAATAHPVQTTTRTTRLHRVAGQRLPDDPRTPSGPPGETSAIARTMSPMTM